MDKLIAILPNLRAWNGSLTAKWTTTNFRDGNEVIATVKRKTSSARGPFPLEIKVAFEGKNTTYQWTSPLSLPAVNGKAGSETDYWHLKGILEALKWSALSDADAMHRLRIFFPTNEENLVRIWKHFATGELMRSDTDASSRWTNRHEESFDVRTLEDGLILSSELLSLSTSLTLDKHGASAQITATRKGTADTINEASNITFEQVVRIIPGIQNIPAVRRQALENEALCLPGDFAPRPIKTALAQWQPGPRP